MISQSHGQSRSARYSEAKPVTTLDYSSRSRIVQILRIVKIHEFQQILKHPTNFITSYFLTFFELVNVSSLLTFVERGLQNVQRC